MPNPRICSSVKTISVFLSCVLFNSVRLNWPAGSSSYDEKLQDVWVGAISHSRAATSVTPTQWLASVLQSVTKFEFWKRPYKCTDFKIEFIVFVVAEMNSDN